MTDAWSQVTGPYYVPPPGQPPNFFAAYMSSFLRAKTPAAMELWKARLAALDPYARYNALAKLADLSNQLYESVSQNWRTRETADAQGQSDMMALAGKLIDADTQHARTAAEVAIANRETSVDMALARNVKTEAGTSLIAMTTGTFPNLASTISNARTDAETKHAENVTRNELENLRTQLGQLRDPGERDAVAERIWQEARKTANELPPRDGDWLMQEVGYFIQPPKPLGDEIPLARGGGRVDTSGVVDRAKQIATQLNIPGAPGSMPLPTPRGGTSGPQLSGYSVSTGGRAPPDPAAAQAYQDALRREIDNLNPFATLGWFGQPVPIPQQAAVAHLQQQLQAGKPPQGDPVREAQAARRRAFAAAQPAAGGTSALNRAGLTPQQQTSGLDALARNVPLPTPPPPRAGAYPGVPGPPATTTTSAPIPKPRPRVEPAQPITATTAASGPWRPELLPPMPADVLERMTDEERLRRLLHPNGR